ncbi:MAG: aldo/keto reductase [Panacagrimonas sp.]|nr:aldo/keto reductase [Panacagrimonas sp.]MCC2658570.1 aldo/keto reductase [Panacagrimonas sp.]
MTQNNATPMPQRTLGKSSLKVSAIGLGCMGMSDFYGPADDKQNLAVLNHAIDIGVNFLDTADMYGPFTNEELIAKLLKTRRREVVIATKFANVRAADGTFIGISGKPEYVQSACEASLKRLGVETIDLYYQHRVDPTVPIEDTVGAMARLVEQGKVRYLGLSEAAGKTVRRAVKVHPIAALQSEYSLWTRDMEADALPTCRELGVGFVPYSPLGRGFLTGAIQKSSDLHASDWRLSNPRFQGEALDHNLKLVRSVQALAQDKGCTPAQLALAWLLHQGQDIVPIPGTRSIARLDENAQAAHVKLSAEDLQRIDGVLTKSEVIGLRYPEAFMSRLNA